MNNHSALHAILRTRFDLFYQRAFAELNPGTPYQHNWHMDAIIHVLQGVRVLLALHPILYLQSRRKSGSAAA